MLITSASVAAVRARRSWGRLARLASLRFNAVATSDRVDHGAAMGAVTAFTAYVWLLPKSLPASNAHILSRFRVNLGTGPTGWRIVSANADVTLAWTRATTNASYGTNDGPLKVDRLTFMAFTLDQAAAPVIHTYWGNLEAGRIKEASYGTAVDGSGTWNDESTYPLLAGNRYNSSAPSQPWDGEQLAYGFYRRILGTHEIEALMWDPWLVLPGAVVVALPGMHGDAIVRDLSPNRYHGTPTGTRLGRTMAFPLTRRRWVSAGLTPVAQTIALPYEALGGLSTTQAVAFESLVGLASTGVLSYESAGQVAASVAAAYEALQALETGQVLAYELTQGLAATAPVPLEALAGLAGTALVPYEASGQVAVAVVLSFEALVQLAATLTLPAEALEQLAAGQAVAFETLAGVALAAPLPFESEGTIAPGRYIIVGAPRGTVIAGSPRGQVIGTPRQRGVT